MRFLFHIVICLMFIQTAYSQGLPINGQIFMNPYYYNPAFAGYEDRPAFYLYSRQQWSGIENAPKTLGFNFHTIFNEKVNFGLHIVNDKRSILSTTNLLFTFGYRASFDEFHYLSFGLSGGVGFNSIDLDQVDLTDPAFQDVLDNNIFLDGNAGINYFNKGFNLGLSLPKIFKNKPLSSTSFETGEINPLNDIIFMTSYKWEISDEKFALEPYINYFYSQEGESQFEVIGLLHLMDAIWIGGSYRQDYGVTAHVGLNIKDNFKFGYAYEFFDAQPANFNNNTHDIQLALIFGKKKGKKKEEKLSAMQKRRMALAEARRRAAENQRNAPPPQDTPVEDAEPENTYSEDDALQDLLEEPEVEEDTIDIFDIQFDEPATPEPEPEVIIAPVPEPIEDVFDEEEDLLMSMDEEEEEFTFEEEVELTDEPAQTAEELINEIDNAEEFVEPTLDEQGLYIGPKTVKKGDHLLELDQGNYVVVGTYTTYRDAEDYSDKLFIEGFYTKFGYISQTKIYYVYIFESEDLQEANDTSERFNMIGAQFRENWVLQVQ